MLFLFLISQCNNKQFKQRNGLYFFIIKWNIFQKSKIIFQESVEQCISQLEETSSFENSAKLHGKCCAIDENHDLCKAMIEICNNIDDLSGQKKATEEEWCNYVCDGKDVYDWCHLSSGIIAVIVISCVVYLILLVFLIYCFIISFRLKTGLRIRYFLISS
jgi:hypothetical protein